MIKKNIKLYALIILLILTIVVIPFSFSKYTTTLSKKIKLSIKPGDITYFKEYNGQNNLLGFDKTDITSFGRNTTLTKEEVLEKENVQLISNEENDGYKSSKEVYGWVEDNHFYWWSEAATVYFHPKTLGAFRELSSIETIDLTGTNTSKVEKFSNWFYNDQVLTTINGKINTSGLKYETGEYTSFYRMFHNCRILTSIDLSEFDTKNATNMSNMFYYCEKLTELDVSKFDTSKVTNMYYMFYFCNKLTKLDVSNFNTSKVTNMGGMFEKCQSLTELDVSNFDTSNVTSMHYMFSGCSSLTVLDVSKFDTSKVTNMYYMFSGCSSLTELDVSTFDTSKVTNMNNMFANCSSLNVIYSKTDFDLSSLNSSTNMFNNNSILIGQYGTEYETVYDASHKDATYAKISNENQLGYFTYYESIDDIKYNITYDLDGGTLKNKNYYYYGSSYTLNIPTKEGYIFAGWTGSNGNNPESIVTIPRGSNGNKYYVAHYIKGNKLNILGPCTFNGSTSNITGDNCKIALDDGTTIDYTSEKYIDTGIYLYNEANYQKDYEIEFTINDYDYSIQEFDQSTLMNSKYENSSLGYPGIVFRKGTDEFEFTQTIEKVKAKKSIPYTKDMKVKISRINGKIYYQINDGDILLLQDMNNLIQYFDVPVTIGASLTSAGAPQRYFKGTLSNISIKLEE